MTRWFKQIITDIRHGHFIDLYATALVSLAFTTVLLIGGDLPDRLRWSLIFGALAILLMRSSAVTGLGRRDEVFLDRADYDKNPVGQALVSAKEVWVFAPVGTNLLTDERCELLRRGPLARPDGSVRVVVLSPFDPQDPTAEQLDALLDYPVQTAAAALRDTHTRLATMAGWQVKGSFAFGTIPFNPGFSLVAVNASSPDGFVNVEFHGFRNDTIAARMHIKLTRADPHWYPYWLEQFEAIWRSADRTEPGQPQAPATRT